MGVFSTTPTYRVETTINRGSLSPIAWHNKYDGSPTEENLEKWRQDYNKSFLPGGYNGPRNDDDAVLYISSARLVHQSTGRIVVETKMPAFEVV